MARTFGELRSEISDWALEKVKNTITFSALNDGIEKLWGKVLMANLSSFMGGPVSFTTAAASERTQLVSIIDPVAAPVLSQQAGGTLPQHTIWVTYTLVTESGSETNVAPYSSLVVNLNQQGIITQPTVVASAIGYNIYAGSTQALAAKQNVGPPIPFDQPFYEPATGFIDRGQANAGPQPPIENTTADDIFYIKTLEVKLTAGGYKRWDQTSIDSTIFKYANRSPASNSEYQPYYWDLVNGRTLEYRPAMGTTLNPRYFYIHKPRRYTVDFAQLPFTTIPHEEFLKSHALAWIFAAYGEIPKHQVWLNLAKSALADVIEVVTQQTWNQNNSVALYSPGYGGY